MPRALFALLLIVPATQAADTPGDFFEKNIRPLLVTHCLKCHGDKKPKGKLSLTSRAALLKGGESGPAIDLTRPDKSLLIQVLNYIDPPRMPPNRKLPAKDIALFARWVKMGAPWPASAPGTTTNKTFTITAEQRRFWSFQPVRRPSVPAVKNHLWANNSIDRFLLATLESKRLRPAKAADRRTYIRRVTFDLIGLPPTTGEVERFLADKRPGAHERLVDRLLASPAYGERWGRHWLDLVRYTDSFDARIVGNEMDCGDAWRYRDWVVNALNADRPYDRFMRDQIAGDVLHADKPTRREGIIATGLLAIGNWGGGDADKEKLLTDIADDQVDVVSRTFLGLTVSCARCHDHKFDPISTADYYGLAGIFFSTHILPNVGPKTNGPPMLRIPLVTPTEMNRRQAHLARIATADKELQAARVKPYQDHARSQLPLTAKYLLAVYDWRHPVKGKELPLARIAAMRNLDSSVLLRWTDFLAGPGYRLMAQPIKDILGHKGVHGWRGTADCPSALINTTNTPRKILTFSLPPKSVSVHPGPKSGVVVSWRSPIRGTVSISGGVADVDSACGDGIAWTVQHRGATLRDLTSGEISNGGKQDFAKGKTPGNLNKIAVEIGDRLELIVWPRQSYDCDTTAVDLTITLADGSKKWNLAADLVPSPHGGKGGAGAWTFFDTTVSQSATPSSLPGLAEWHKAVNLASSGKSDRKSLEAAAATFARVFTLVDARSPYWIRSSAEETRLSEAVRNALKKREKELADLRKVTFAAPDYANGAQEGGVPKSPHAGTHDVRIHIRGRYDRLGPLVPRRFPEILAGTKQPPIKQGSGRKELAWWLSDAKNPLPARVMVNRLWQFHFGRGIVNTPSNFGKLGEKPTHPELLDWLAAEFVESGWSMKHMHRLMVLSATYRQSCEGEATTHEADPDNLLLGRMRRRRLEAEAVRDNLLAVAGTIDRRAGGKADRGIMIPRRGIYQMDIRSDRAGFGPLFDGADSTAPTDKRTISTVAPQALFLLNSDFARTQATALARRILAASKSDPERVTFAYRLLYARVPSKNELTIGTAYLKNVGGDEKGWRDYLGVLLCANEFVYID